MYSHRLKYHICRPSLLWHTRTRTRGCGLLDGLRPVAGIPVDDGRATGQGATQAVVEGARVASGSVG